MDLYKQAEQIKVDFAKCRKLLTAIGDETRQAIITTLMESDCDGVRVGEITAKTHLSRPAVSHHIKILLDCGMVGVDRQGTRNFYYLNVGEEFMALHGLVNHIAELWQAADLCQKE